MREGRESSIASEERTSEIERISPRPGEDIKLALVSQEVYESRSDGEDDSAEWAVREMRT